MKRFMILATAALISSGALAQTAVQVAPEQRMKIKEYVLQKKVAPAKMTERVTIGAMVPQNVELAPVPSEWGPTFTNYRYIYTNDNVILVDPNSRKVVHIID